MCTTGWQFEAVRSVVYPRIAVYTGLGVVSPPITLSSIPTFSMSAATATIPALASIMAAGTTPPASTLQDPSVKRSLPLPAKLVKRILDLEFVDMVELVPDSWRYQEEEAKCCHQPKRQRRGPVTDILLWVECYVSLVEVLCTGHPDKVPEFMAYQQTIVKAHRTFLGEGWVTYDTCFRRKAAAMKSLQWGQVDFNLYNETFTGRAKSLVRCQYCASEHHTSTECTFAPELPHQATSSRQVQTRYDTSRLANNICNLFNHKYGDQCKFSPCKFTHLCSECRGRHPASQCRQRPAPFSRTPRGERAESPGRASGKK